MADEHLLKSPHKIPRRKDAWWYEEPAGIIVVVEPGEGTAQVKITWRQIKAALGRKMRPSDGA